MKKYIQPNVKLIEIESTEILAGSELNNLSEGNGNDALGRGFDLTWDDEDEK